MAETAEERNVRAVQRQRGLHIQEDLAFVKREIDELNRQKDVAYAERDMLASTLARTALDLGWTAGMKRHVPAPGEQDWDDEWANVVLIDLPSGQISFHVHVAELPWFSFLPEYPGEWDGHTTEQKYERLLKGWPTIGWPGDKRPIMDKGELLFVVDVDARFGSAWFSMDETVYNPEEGPQ